MRLNHVWLDSISAANSIFVDGKVEKDTAPYLPQAYVLLRNVALFPPPPDITVSPSIWALLTRASPTRTSRLLPEAKWSLLHLTPCHLSNIGGFGANFLPLCRAAGRFLVPSFFHSTSEETTELILI